ncbi:MAG TPA: hypothetical protein VHO48_14650 [Anaerolineaceae bacterium]|jgi:hypothetical protein|nr:hypothetical protein [Anaerolineaceae bacterium]
MVLFDWTNVLLGLIPVVPLALVWLAGIVYAAVTWKRHPRVSLLAVLGLIIMALATLAGTTSNYLPLLIHARTGQDFGRLGGIVFVINIGIALVQALGLGLVLAAAFAGRKRNTEAG